VVYPAWSASGGQILGSRGFADAGVDAASRRCLAYQDAIVEMVVHRLKSEKAAQALLTSLCVDLATSA
jgi:hypothetical protein